MPKVLVVSSLPEILEPWIAHLTAQNITAITINKLPFDQRIGVAKLHDIDAIFLVISKTLSGDYLKDDCAKIKMEMAEGIRLVPEETPVFIVLANSTETEQERFKEKFAIVEGIIGDTHETISLYQVGQKNPKYVHDIFGYSNRKNVSNLSSIDHLKSEFLQKIKGIIRVITRVNRVSPSSKAATETREQKKPAYKEDKKEEDQIKKDEPPATKNKTQNSQPSPAETKNAIFIKTTLQRDGENNEKNRRDETSLQTSDEYPSIQQLEELESLSKPRVKGWKIGFPIKITCGTFLTLASLVGVFEIVGLIVDSIIVPTVTTSLLTKCGLLASLISGTALASLTPLGVVAIGIAIITLIVGIAAFCYVNRKHIFGASPDTSLSVPEESNEELLEVDNLLGDNLDNQEEVSTYYANVYHDPVTSPLVGEVASVPRAYPAGLRERVRGNL